jgi:hypothetical protein
MQQPTSCSSSPTPSPLRPRLCVDARVRRKRLDVAYLFRRRSNQMPVPPLPPAIPTIKFRTSVLICANQWPNRESWRCAPGQSDQPRTIKGPRWRGGRHGLNVQSHDERRSIKENGPPPRHMAGMKESPSPQSDANATARTISRQIRGGPKTH